VIARALPVSTEQKTFEAFDLLKLGILHFREDFLVLVLVLELVLVLVLELVLEGDGLPTGENHMLFVDQQSNP
jgi:hypothetical protein